MKDLATATLVCLAGTASWAAVQDTAVAEKTAIDVRVISKEAKFVGTSMGGAEVTIRDAATGMLLARGKTSGTTGDTDTIMRTARKHHDPISTPDAAVFHAEIELEEPRQIKVTARGPLAQPQAMNEVSATQWVVPGLPIRGGDGFLLELPGLVVDILAPPAHVVISESEQKTAQGHVTLRANVCMMCGCPITADGLWSATELDVSAIVLKDGKKVAQHPLTYAGQASHFTGSVVAKEAGTYQVIVYAHNPSNGNTGVDKTTFIVDAFERP